MFCEEKEHKRNDSLLLKCAFESLMQPSDKRIKCHAGYYRCYRKEDAKDRRSCYWKVLLLEQKYPILTGVARCGLSLSTFKQQREENDQDE